MHLPFFSPCSCEYVQKGNATDPGLTHVLIKDAADISLGLCLKPKKLRSLYGLTVARALAASSEMP